MRKYFIINEDYVKSDFVVIIKIQDANYAIGLMSMF